MILRIAMPLPVEPFGTELLQIVGIDPKMLLPRSCYHSACATSPSWSFVSAATVYLSSHSSTKWHNPPREDIVRLRSLVLQNLKPGTDATPTAGLPVVMLTRRRWREVTNFQASSIHLSNIPFAQIVHLQDVHEAVLAATVGKAALVVCHTGKERSITQQVRSPSVIEL